MITLGLPLYGAGGLLRGFGHSLEALNVSSTGEWPFTLKMIIGAPLIGMASSYTLMVLVYWCHPCQLRPS
jgi:hypothetical protein